MVVMVVMVVVKCDAFGEIDGDEDQAKEGNPKDDLVHLKETQILVSGRRLGRRSGSGDLNTRRMFPHW